MCECFIYIYVLIIYLLLILSKQSRSKWLREAAKSHKIKSLKKSKEDPLKTIPIVRAISENPLTKEAPLNSRTVFARLAPIPVLDTDPISDIPSSILSDLSPQLAEQLNCPIFDLELGVLSTQVRATLESTAPHTYH